MLEKGENRDLSEELIVVKKDTLEKLMQSISALTKEVQELKERSSSQPLSEKKVPVYPSIQALREMVELSEKAHEMGLRERRDELLGKVADIIIKSENQLSSSRLSK